MRPELSILAVRYATSLLMAATLSILRALRSGVSRHGHVPALDQIAAGVRAVELGELFPWPG